MKNHLDLEDIINEGIEAAELCAVSYDDEFSHLFYGFTCRHPVIENHDQQCHILSNEKITVLLFPGTEEARDLLLDLDKKYDANVKDFGIHRGVNKGLNYIWDDIIDVLSMTDYKNKPIKIYGHSLGGAYAAEAGRRLVNVFSIVCIYTFGMFKLYDKRGYDSYTLHHCHYNFINAGDLVSRYPLRRCMEKHLGNILYLTRKNKVIEGFPRLRFWVEYFCSPIVRALDHRIVNYIKRLKKV